MLAKFEMKKQVVRGLYTALLTVQRFSLQLKRITGHTQPKTQSRDIHQHEWQISIQPRATTSPTLQPELITGVRTKRIQGTGCSAYTGLVLRTNPPGKVEQTKHYPLPPANRLKDILGNRG